MLYLRPRDSLYNRHRRFQICRTYTHTLTAVVCCRRERLTLTEPAVLAKSLNGDALHWVLIQKASKNVAK